MIEFFINIVEFIFRPVRFLKPDRSLKEKKPNFAQNITTW
tara:strand:- start:1029 stop:1148 length:120 start_codon:yes stop_codon:yes gene_type:complete